MWLIYYGHAVFHMDRREVNTTALNVMMDLISLHSVYNDVAEEKHARRMSIDEALALR